MAQCQNCQREHDGNDLYCVDCQDRTVFMGQPSTVETPQQPEPVAEEKPADTLAGTRKTSGATADADVDTVGTHYEKPNLRILRSLPEENIGVVLFDRYEIEKVLGKGGMGTVYLANDIKLSGKKRAIKEIYLDQKFNTEQVEEFSAEAQMLIDLNHPHIPQIIDYQKPTDDGYIYIVMDYVKGMTLEAKFLQQQSLSYQKLTKYVIQICNIFEYLHNLEPQVVYRDLKPSNIMIDEKDNVQLIDFGIARKYQEGQYSDTVNFGTFGFGAPEQYIKNMQTDHRTDLYALGATMYYVLSGGQKYAPAHQRLETYNAGLPVELYTIVHKLLEHHPTDRYQSAKELKQDLMTIGTTANTNKDPQPKAKKPKRNMGALKKKFKLFFIFAFIFALIGGGVYGYYYYLTLQNAPSKMLLQFEKAIIAEDAKTVASLLQTEDERLQINETTVLPFIQYFNENPTALPEVMDHLEAQGKDVKDGIKPSKAKTDSPSMLHSLSVAQAEKLYYVVNTYKITVDPIFTNIEVNNENVKIYFNDTEVALSDSTQYSATVGPYLPGVYNVYAELQSDFSKLGDERAELFLQNGSGDNPLISFDLAGDTVYIAANYGDARIFVNGKDTGQLAKDIRYFGPVTVDGSMDVYAMMDFDWESVMSEKVFIKDTSQIDLVIEPMTPKLKELVFELAEQYGISVFEGYNAKNMEQVKRSSPKVIEGLAEQLRRTLEAEPTWQATLRKIVVDQESLQFYTNDNGEYEVAVKVTFQYQQKTAKGTENKNQYQQLLLTYDTVTNGWIVNRMKIIDTVSTENPKDIIVSEE